MNIGVRQLRDGLSKHLVAVRAGEEITVTDHGRPIARLIPYDAPSGLEKLIAAGLVTPAARSKGDRLAPIDIGTTVSDLIAEGRGAMLDIDPAVLSAAQAKARSERISLGRAVSDLAMRGMQRDPAAHAGYRNGFPVMHGVPGRPIADELVAEHRDDG